MVSEYLERSRTEVSRQLDKIRRASLGQFLTPVPLARLMASLFDDPTSEEVSIIDPGAGIGTLLAMLTLKLCSVPGNLRRVKAVAYEIDPIFLKYLKTTVEMCKEICETQGITLEARIELKDYISCAASSVFSRPLSTPLDRFTHAILNPPYHKVNTDSRTRLLLRKCGIETSNVYTGFMALTSILLAPGGEMVSITPRSFCNGVYFKSFRRDFLGYMSIEKIHSFESRTQAFKDDKVLQENIILKTRKSAMPSPTIQVSLTLATNMDVRTVEVPRHQVVAPDDKDAIIHVITEELESRVSPMAGRLTYTLRSLGLEVSTGPVVDFRATEYIVQSSNKKAVPLIYPYHMYQGYVNWPALNPKKPDGLLSIPETRRLLLPLGYYVVVKRFSSKEQKRRITAALYDASRFKFKFVGFENHLNYIHAGADGLDSTVAKGLVAFLNSTVVDSMFRLFSGHTQVNADDLRRLKYPSLDELKSIGMQIGEEFPDQNTLDRIINTIIGTHS